MVGPASPVARAVSEVGHNAEVSSLRLSPSGAATWAQCPRRWWYRYVDRLPEPPPGEPAVLGTFVHRILELLLTEEPADRTTDRARLLARAVYDEFVESEDWQVLELDDDGAKRFRQRAWATVEAYFGLVAPHEVAPVARELEVEAEIDGVPFRGFIDLVEAAGPAAGGGGGRAGDGRAAGADAGDGRPAVVITDYKTGRPPEQGKPWSDERIADKLLQPQWYAAALAELGEHRPVRARLLFFGATDAAGGPGFELFATELGVDVDDEALAPARAELRRRWDDIQHALDAGVAAAEPGPLCGWCPYVELCEEGAAECRRRWNDRNDFTGDRRLRADAPAAVALGLVDLPGVRATA